MKTSIHKLIKDLKAVVFEKDELEFRDLPELKSLLPLQANQDSTSDVEIKIWKFWKRTVRFKYRANDWHLDWNRNKTARVEEVEVWTPRYNKTISTFRQFWSIKIPKRDTNSTTSQSNIPTQVGNFRLRFWRKTSSQFLWGTWVVKIEKTP